MKKSILFLAFAVAVAFTSCSKDDDDKCNSCTAQDQKIEICENSDGSYTLTVGGESSEIETLDGLTPKQVVDATCAALNTLGN